MTHFGGAQYCPGVPLRCSTLGSQAQVRQKGDVPASKKPAKDMGYWNVPFPLQGCLLSPARDRDPPPFFIWRIERLDASQVTLTYVSEIAST